MGRWDKPNLGNNSPFGDPWSQRWFKWGQGLDKVLSEIEDIDKESTYHRLKYILKHDENRGYDNPEALR